MKILATDLDRTLLPNGKWPVDDQAISLFNEWTAKQGVLVVYVTGRNLQLTEQAIEKYGVRFPDILCGDVGTTIRHYIKSEWRMDLGWIDNVHAMSPRWDNVAIRQAIAEVQGLREQEAIHLNQFKRATMSITRKPKRLWRKLSNGLVVSLMRCWSTVSIHKTAMDC